MNIIRVIIGILVFLFEGYMFLDDSRRGIASKLSKEERRYFDIIEWWFIISTMLIWGFMLLPLYEYFS